MAKVQILGEPTNLSLADPRQATQKPMSIPAKDDSYIMSASDALERMSEAAKKINDYNDETEIYTQLQELSNTARIQQWTPDQYKKEYDKFISSINFDNPELKANVMRYAELHYADTVSHLQAIQYKKTVAKSLAATNTFLDTLRKGITDPTTYASALVQAKVRVERLVDSGILNELGAQKLLEGFKSDAAKTLITTQMLDDPQKFIEDVKSGVYDGVLEGKAQKQIVLEQARRQLERMQLEQERQKKELYAELTKKYAVEMATGKINMDSILKSDLPDDVKYNLLMIESRVTADPSALATYGQIEQKIKQGYYASLADLQSELNSALKDRKLNRSMYLRLQDYYLSHTTDEGSLSQIFKSRDYKRYSDTFIPSAIKEVFAQVAQIGGSSFIKTLKPGKYYTRAQEIFDNLIKENCKDAPCNMRLLATKAMWQAIRAPLKEDFYYENGKMGMPNIFGKWAQDLGVDSAFIQAVSDKIFDTFVANEEYNPLHEIRLNKVIEPNIDYPPIKVPLPLKVGAAYVRLKIKNENGVVEIIPKTKADEAALQAYREWLDKHGSHLIKKDAEKDAKKVGSFSPYGEMLP